jgi:membrane associated rhomboid family serine protease
LQTAIAEGRDLMLFFPYKLDIALYRIPFFTILVCVICIATFLSQVKSSTAFARNLGNYCAHEINADLQGILNAIDDSELGAGCGNIFYGIRESRDHDATIARLSHEVRGLEFYVDGAKDVAYKESVIRYGYEQFVSFVPKELTDKLAFRPGEYDFVGMFTSTFAHASWGHLIGNLIFFFIFASCVESALGYGAFVGAFLLMAVVTSMAYSRSVIGTDALPAIGLSGVAMGMMALLTTMLPRAKIWCFFWFLFFFRRFTLPVLVIAAWHIGWNIYDLKHADPSSHINYVAHVSGAVTGIVLGILYRLFAQQRLQQLEMAMES